MCLPIIAPPQVRGRELFIDGSLVDNLPVEAMADMGEGPIIAVDVKATFERPAADGERAGASEPTARARGAGAAPEPRRDAHPGAAARQRQHLRGGPPARRPVIKPRAEGVGLLEFHQLDAAREAGRAAAREALEATPAGLWA